MKIKFKKDWGFTLIEILVAMLVLAIGLLGLAGVTVVVMRSNLLSQQVTDATNVAADLMDKVRRANPGTVTATNTNCFTTITAPANASTCPIIASSGIGSMYNPGGSSVNFYPQQLNGTTGGAECGLRGILGSTTASALTFDIVNSSGLTTVGTTAPSDNICNLSSTALGAGQYVRYYRTYNPGGTSSTADRTIIVVVLWKDKFGNWRNVHLSTSQ